MAVDSLLRAANAVTQKRNQFLRTNYNLTGAQFDFLNALYAHHDPVSIGKLADELGCGRANLTVLSDNLERDGWITREHSKEDRRVVLVDVADQRKGKLRQAMSETANFLAQWDKQLSPAAATLNNLTAQLAG